MSSCHKKQKKPKERSFQLPKLINDQLWQKAQGKEMIKVDAFKSYLS